MVIKKSGRACDICGRRMAIWRKDVYQVQEELGILERVVKLPRQFDAINCPSCGCQNILAPRLWPVEEEQKAQEPVFSFEPLRCACPRCDRVLEEATPFCAGCGLELTWPADIDAREG